MTQQQIQAIRREIDICALGNEQSAVEEKIGVVCGD